MTNFIIYLTDVNFDETACHISLFWQRPIQRIYSMHICKFALFKKIRKLKIIFRVLSARVCLYYRMCLLHIILPVFAVFYTFQRSAKKFTTNGDFSQIS